MASDLFATGLLADYQFNTGSGTSLVDASGNGNNGTLGPTGFTAPTWVSTGLLFDGVANGISLPAGITWANIVCVQMLISSTGPLTSISPIIGNSIAADFHVALMNTGNPLTTQIPNIGTWANGYQNVPFLWCPPGFGPQLASFTRKASGGDTWFHDLADTDLAYETAGNTLGSFNGGNLFLGVSPDFGTGTMVPFKGIMHRVVFYSSDPGQTAILANHAQMKADAVAKGVVWGQANPTTDNVLVIDGDSITQAGYSGSSGTVNSWVGSLSLSHAFDTYNFAIGGQSLVDIKVRSAWTSLPMFAPAGPKSIYVIFAGTNDIALGGQSGATVFGYLQTASAAALAKGFQGVVIVPMLSRTGWETQKNAYNSLIFGNSWGSSVYVVPASALPNLVPDGSATNGTWFTPDNIHLQQVGQTQLAAAISTGINSPFSPGGMPGYGFNYLDMI